MEPVAPYGSLLIEGAGERRQVALKLGSNTLGRAPECDIQLDVEGVSREHARIVCTSQRCLIADRGSRNGTFVNDVRLEPNQQRQLQNGDVLKIGVFRIRYNAPRAARTPPQPLRQRQSDSAQTSARPTRPGVDAGKLIPPANQRSRYLDYLPPSYDCEPESFFNNFLLIFESHGWPPGSMRRRARTGRSNGGGCSSSTPRSCIAGAAAAAGSRSMWKC
jgi:pSer/pThr/pTyr-binding forkhead associated (FHA) protein